MIGFPPKAPESSTPGSGDLATAESSKRILLGSSYYRAWVEVGCPGPGDPISPASRDVLSAASALDVRRKIEAARLRAARGG